MNPNNNNNDNDYHYLGSMANKKYNVNNANDRTDRTFSAPVANKEHNVNNAKDRTLSAPVANKGHNVNGVNDTILSVLTTNEEYKVNNADDDTDNVPVTNEEHKVNNANDSADKKELRAMVDELRKFIPAIIVVAHAAIVNGIEIGWPLENQCAIEKIILEWIAFGCLFIFGIIYDLKYEPIEYSKHYCHRALSLLIYLLCVQDEPLYCSLVHGHGYSVSLLKYLSICQLVTLILGTSGLIWLNHRFKCQHGKDHIHPRMFNNNQ